MLHGKDNLCKWQSEFDAGKHAKNRETGRHLLEDVLEGSYVEVVDREAVHVQDASVLQEAKGSHIERDIRLDLDDAVVGPKLFADEHVAPH